MKRSILLLTLILLLVPNHGSAMSSSSTSINDRSERTPLMQSAKSSANLAKRSRSIEKEIGRLSKGDWKKLSTKKTGDIKKLNAWACECVELGFNPKDTICDTMASGCCWGTQLPEAAEYLLKEYDRRLYVSQKSSKSSSEIQALGREIQVLKGELAEQKTTIQGLVKGLENAQKQNEQLTNQLESIRTAINEQAVQQTNPSSDASSSSQVDTTESSAELDSMRKDLEDQKQTLKDHDVAIRILKLRTAGINSFKALTAAQSTYAKYQSSGTEAQRSTTLDELVDDFKIKARTAERKGYENLKIKEDDVKRFDDELKTKRETK